MVLYFFGVDDSRLRAAQAVVRIKAEMRKSQPTSTGVHVDAVMGSVPPRAGVNGIKRKKRKKVKEVAAMGKGRGGLGEWFEEKWVDISRPKEGGGFEPCGRADAESGKYPKCVPSSKAAAMSEKERKSAVRRKRKAEASETRVDKKPVNVATLAKSKNVPTDKELYARVKAEAKKKFDVYPSAYANAWLVREYKSRGGGYRVEKASFASRSEAGRYAAEQRWKGNTPKKDATGSGSPELTIVEVRGNETFGPYKNGTFTRRATLTVLDDKGKEFTVDVTAKGVKGDQFIEVEAKRGNKQIGYLWAANDKTGEYGQKGKIAIGQVDVIATERRKGIATALMRLGKRYNIDSQPIYHSTVLTTAGAAFARDTEIEKASSPAWQRKAGKNPKGGLNAKGRASYARETGGKLKAPVKAGDNPRRASFLARMGNMAGPERDANGEPTRLLLSLQAWGANSKAEARKKAKAISARNEKKVNKASFATRSEAGRYAANMRWQDNQSSPNIDTGAGAGYAGGMGTSTVTPAMGVKETAAAIRKDLKAAQKSGQLPSDVRFSVKFVDADAQGYRPNTPRLTTSEIKIVTENYEQWRSLSDDAKKLVGDISNSHNPLVAYEVRDGGNNVMTMQRRAINIRPVLYKA